MRIALDKFTKTFGSLTVIEQMDLEIHDGEMIALLGPSGCGKSTTLFAICGIHRVNGGRILFGDKDVSNVPSQERNVGVVFQSYALYPHMTIYDNIAFPLRIKNDAQAEIDRKINDISGLLHISELLQRRPAELSGGQQQRVALARALVREPAVLLLDEPLANLDAQLRLEMRAEIRRIQQQAGITAILVTHDQVEAMSMCDRIAIMNNGRIIQIAEPEDMYDNPATDFVAGFLGNPPIAFLNGQVKEDRFIVPGSDIELQLSNGYAALETGQSVRLGVRPEFFQPNGSAPISGTVSFVESPGRETLYDVTLADGSNLRSVQSAKASVGVGDLVKWGINMNRALLFDETGGRINRTDAND